METLTRASDELFRRGPDERFDSVQSLYDHCYATRTNSIDRWQPPQSIQPTPTGGRFRVTVGNDGEFSLNDWSFGQLCRLAGVSRGTLDRLSPRQRNRDNFTALLPGGRDSCEHR